MSRIRIPLLPSAVRWSVVAAVAGALVYFSVVTAPTAPPEPGPLWDKKLHFAGYAALGLALAYATTASPRSTARRGLLVVAAGIAFGVIIELLQGPLPDRYFSYGEMLANAIGALLAAGWFALEPRVRFVPFPDRAVRDTK